MATNNRDELSGLMKIAGLRSESFLPSQPITCPFCASASVTQLMGKINFGATIAGNDLFEGEPQPLAAFVCPQSHVFFLREGDVLPAESSRATA